MEPCPRGPGMINLGLYSEDWGLHTVASPAPRSLAFRTTELLQAQLPKQTPRNSQAHAVGAYCQGSGPTSTCVGVVPRAREVTLFAAATNSAAASAAATARRLNGASKCERTIQALSFAMKQIQIRSMSPQALQAASCEGRAMASATASATVEKAVLWK